MAAARYATPLGLQDVSCERPEVGPPQSPDSYLRHAPATLVLVAGDLADAAPELERTHQHFLLDGRQVGLQAERKRHVSSKRAKSVLAVGEPDAPPIVDREHDQ